MKKSNLLVIFSVSVYVLFFAIALWSALPSSETGRMAGPASIVEPQLTTCELWPGATVGQEGSQFMAQTDTGRRPEAQSSGRISEESRASYQCALQTGALFN